MLRFRVLVNLGVIAILLSGCAGSLSSSTLPTKEQNNTSSGSHVFHYAGRKQGFTVPTGVTSITITATGASGRKASSSDCTGQAGNGGLVEAMINVTPGEKLSVRVGGKNGFNGGGGAPSDALNGGGASDVRQGGDKLANRVVVSGGGGGGGGSFGCGWDTGGPGGAGGGKVGNDGGIGGVSDSGDPGGGGSGGTQRIGGQGGSAGQCSGYCGSGYCNGEAGGNGSLGDGGAGASTCGGSGGGGGGGYYGGGGGGSGDYWYYGLSQNPGPGGGGGGGSSFIEKTATKIKNIQGGASPGNGKIVISWR
jgi:hypothetical protein